MISMVRLVTLLRRESNWIIYSCESKNSVGRLMQMKQKYLMKAYLFYVLIVSIFMGFQVFSMNAFAEERKSVAIFEPELKDKSVIVGREDENLDVPNILKTKFLNLPTVSNTEQRIERLLQGITTDIPPEYDHYGYEIRRYMARVGDRGVYESKKRLIEELTNVRKAQVIVDYWQKTLDKELEFLDAQVESVSVSQSAIVMYKQNKSTVRSFLITLKGWVDSNERILSFLVTKQGSYESYYPEIVFNLQSGDVVDFYNSVLLRQTKLKMIRKYPPFSLMVY